MSAIKLDYSLISEIELEINTADAPDFSDSYITAAMYGDRPMTDDELDVLNDDSEFVYEAVIARLY